MARRAARKNTKSAGPSPAAEQTDAYFKVARGVTLAGLAALLVATPLVPSEGAVDFGTGTVLVMLWLVLLTCWSGLIALERKPAVCLGPLDVVVMVFFGLVALSSMVMISAGYARATINMLWQWLSFGTCYILCRQLLRTPSSMRAVSAVMIGLAICLSTLAYYQYFYSLPRDRAAYDRDPEGMLREAGIDSTEGSPERKLFDDRLHSTEPTATFALTNSLAGFLTPWLIVALGIGLTAVPPKRLTPYVVVAAAFICLYLGLCLLLTKSRSAILATAMGATILAMWWWRKGHRLGWRTVLGGAAAVGVLLGGLIIAGALDRLVLTETPKSLLYRLQYWQATSSMIAEQPWFGCGAGNFQQYYTNYKLPEASESISDPHNLLFEVWSNAGTPAALAFIAILVLLTWRLFRRARAGDALEHDGDATESQVPGKSRVVYAGAAVGVLLGYSAATVAGFMPDTAVLWLGAPVAAIAVSVLHPWCQRGHLTIPITVIALAVLTTNLLAAGGISFSGVALTWWFLLAIVVNMSETDREFRAVPRGAAIAILLLAVVLTGACYQTEYRPVLRCQAEMADGLASQQAGYPAQAEAAFRRAAAADRFSAEPWTHLAALQFHTIQATGDRGWLAEFDQSTREVIDRTGKSHTTFRRLGGWRLALFQKLADRQQLLAAIKAYQDWVRLYPNSSLAHAQLAWSFHLSGDLQAAASEADIALRLDQQNPHRERKLAEQRVFDPTGSPAAAEDAEQLMYRLRR